MVKWCFVTLLPMIVALGYCNLSQWRVLDFGLTGHHTFCEQLKGCIPSLLERYGGYKLLEAFCQEALFLFFLKNVHSLPLSSFFVSLAFSFPHSPSLPLSLYCSISPSLFVRGHFHWHFNLWHCDRRGGWEGGWGRTWCVCVCACVTSFQGWIQGRIVSVHMGPHQPCLCVPVVVQEQR